MFTIFLMMVAVLAATTPPPLVPSSKWVMNYAEQSCTLSRSFRIGSDEIGLAMVPDPTRTTEIVLFLPDKHDNAPLPKDVVFLGANGATAPASSFVLSFPMTGGKELTALKVCQADLFKEWGIDPAVSIYARAFRRDTTVARGDPQTAGANTWFKTDDYPSDAVGREGEVKALWRIGGDGKPDDCRVFKSSGVKALDDATCASILKKGMYKPIVDEHGNPSAGWDWERVVWLRPR